MVRNSILLFLLSYINKFSKVKKPSKKLMNTQIIIALLFYYMKYDFNDNHFSVEIKK